MRRAAAPVPVRLAMAGVFSLLGGVLSAACGAEPEGPPAGPLSTTGGAAGTSSAAGAGGSGPAGSSGAAGVSPLGGVSGGGTTGAAGAIASAGGGGSASGAAGAAGASGAPPFDRSQRQLLLRDEGNSAVHYVDLADPAKNWHSPVPVGRDLQLIGGRRFLIGTESGYQERNLSDGSLALDVKSFPGTLDAHRLQSGNTLLVGIDFQGGKGIVLAEIAPSGLVARKLQYPGSYARMVRETGSGNFLIAADTRVFEGDADGKVVWEATAQGHAEPHVWEGLRLASGDVLVSSGYAASLQIFGADQQLKQTITGGAGVTPHFFADVQVMPGGSFVVANWQGHGTGLGGSGPQVVEYDADGKLVWSWKQDASFVSSLQQLVVLDGLDVEKLHVESPLTGVLEPVN